MSIKFMLHELGEGWAYVQSYNGIGFFRNERENISISIETAEFILS